MPLPPSARGAFFNARNLCLRIGECLRFGCSEPQTQRAAALVRRIVSEDQRLRGDSEDQRLRGDSEARPEHGTPELKISVPPGPIQGLTIKTAHTQFALDLAQDTIRRAHMVARGGDPKDVAHVDLLKTRPRLHHSFPKFRSLVSEDVVCAEQAFDTTGRYLFPDDAGEDSEAREPWSVCVTTHISSRLRLDPLGNGIKAGHVEMFLPASVLPPDVMEVLPAAEVVDRDETRYLYGAVRDLEKETWDREDAVEDVGDNT